MVIYFFVGDEFGYVVVDGGVVVVGQLQLFVIGQIDYLQVVVVDEVDEVVFG